MSELRYEISNWHQLPMCKSNTSNDLSIQVSDILNDHRLSAVIISVVHEEFGDLYTVLVNPKGTIMYDDFTITPQKILSDLRCFGFIVQFSERARLPGKTLTKLMTLQTMGFDKIRPIEVYNPITQTTANYIIAFIIEKHPEWIYLGYAAKATEFNAALNDGTALNVSALSYYQDIDWSWLDYVANIDDILRDSR